MTSADRQAEQVMLAESERWQSERAASSMAAAALQATGCMEGSFGATESAIRGLSNFGETWLRHPEDPRGAVLRALVSNLVDMVARADAEMAQAQVAEGAHRG